MGNSIFTFFAHQRDWQPFRPSPSSYPCGRIKAWFLGNVVAVAEGQEIDEFARSLECHDVVLKRHVRNTGFGSVCLRTSELLLRDILVRD